MCRGFAHEAVEHLLMKSRVRKLLFTRRKSNQNGVSSVHIKSEAGFARARQSGVVLVMRARKRALWLPSIQIIFLVVVASLGF